MGRSPCCSSEQGLNRGAWTAMEDKILIDFISAHGEGRWRNIPKKAGLKRCGKSCRLRWLNYLRPDIKRGNISPDEEELIIRLHKLLGNRWSLIAGRLPGRTDNEIKNYWNTNLGKKVQNYNQKSISIRSEKIRKDSSKKKSLPENASPAPSKTESPAIQSNSEKFSQLHMNQNLGFDNNSEIKPTINGDLSGFNSLLLPPATDFMKDINMDDLCFSDILISDEPEMLPEKLTGDWTFCFNGQTNVASFLDSGRDWLAE